MSSQSIAVQAFCFEGMKDVQSIADALAQSDPEAARELRKIDWVSIRKHVAKESLQQLASEQNHFMVFVDALEASVMVAKQNLLKLHPQDEVIGAVCDSRGIRRYGTSEQQDFIQIGMSFAADGTCECFGNYLETDDPRSRPLAPTGKPNKQVRLEEIYRERMTKAVFQVLLGTDAYEVKTTKEGTVVMRFLLKGEV